MRAFEQYGVAAILALGVVLLGISVPHNGEFWWSDAPRHALNGVFVKDLVTAMPIDDPVGYATRYYLQYPALTILFYPPLFYAVSAPFYAIFGVSHMTALLVVLLHDFAFAMGLYALARRSVDVWIALAVALCGLAAPGIALWGRQIMLELPALAYAVWGMVLMRRYADASKPGYLYGGAFLLLCGVYTKITVAFLAPVAAVMLWVALGNALWRNRHTWFVAVLFAVGLAPIIFLTLKFGQANVESVTGIADAQVARNSLGAYLWYAQQLPEQLWWPVLGAAIAWPVTVLLRRGKPGMPYADLTMLLGWFIIGYVFFSLIDLKEARHSTLILPPLLIVAGVAIARLLPLNVARGVAVCMVMATAFYTARYVPVPSVAGYAEAADWIAAHAPKDTVVMFSGKRDGSFVFNLRADENRRDITTIRSDKLLLDVSVRRELGVKEKNLSTDEIGDMLNRYGISYAVAQSDFWTDLTEMARLQQVLRADGFEEVARIPIVANVPTEDKELRIYRNLHPAAAGAALTINLPIIGRSIEGTVGSQK